MILKNISNCVVLVAKHKKKPEIDNNQKDKLSYQKANALHQQDFVGVTIVITVPLTTCIF